MIGGCVGRRTFLRRRIGAYGGRRAFFGGRGDRWISWEKGIFGGGFEGYVGRRGF